MVAPRGLTVEAARGPQVVIPPGTGGGPGKLETPALVRVRRDLRRVENQAVAAMASVLTAGQLEKYRRFVQIGNKQYMANAGLL